mmetsp:Transcript_1346/g.2664  ORF Transcript_1346/g.2664 Transcript_1346/m.2664 type:complete len:388 (-) Transcript_1346:69-1232(-)
MKLDHYPQAVWNLHLLEVKTRKTLMIMMLMVVVLKLLPKKVMLLLLWKDKSQRFEKKTQATPIEKKTNIDARLTQAQESYTRDASRQRSKDVGVLSTKFRQFRIHLNELKPIIKSYQQANKELHAARTKLYSDLAVMSVDSPFYDIVGKKLDSDALSEAPTTEAAIQVAEESQTHSLVGVNQIAKASLPVLEAEYQEQIVDYILEWQAAVANKVDKLMKDTEDMRVKQQHYRVKLEKLREEKSASDAKGKDFPMRKREKLVRNEEKYRQSMNEHEEKASELCHMLESVVNLAWQDMMPLVQHTMIWERARYDNDDGSYANQFRVVLESLSQEITRVEAEEDSEDLEAALSIQKEKHEILKDKLNRLQMALSGDWETKNELFRKFDVM